MIRAHSDDDDTFAVKAIPIACRTAVINDGFGYTFWIADDTAPWATGMVRVNVIPPENERYRIIGNVPVEEAQAWYEKHHMVDLWYEVMSFWKRQA